AGGVRVARPVGVPVGGDGDHVAAYRVGVERIGVRCRVGDHGVQHLGCDQHGHGREPVLVGGEVGVERFGYEIAEDVAELLDVLGAVGPLPLCRLPLLAADAAPAGQAGPVRFDEGAPAVGVWLAGSRGGVGHELSSGLG